jgi:hypothetical protein
VLLRRNNIDIVWYCRPPIRSIRQTSITTLSVSLPHLSSPIARYTISTMILCAFVVLCYFIVFRRLNRLADELSSKLGSSAKTATAVVNAASDGVQIFSASERLKDVKRYVGGTARKKKST